MKPNRRPVTHRPKPEARCCTNARPHPYEHQSTRLWVSTNHVYILNVKNDARVNATLRHGAPRRGVPRDSLLRPDHGRHRQQLQGGRLRRHPRVRAKDDPAMSRFFHQAFFSGLRRSRIVFRGAGEGRENRRGKAMFWRILKLVKERYIRSSTCTTRKRGRRTFFFFFFSVAVPAHQCDRESFYVFQ